MPDRLVSRYDATRYRTRIVSLPQGQQEEEEEEEEEGEKEEDDPCARMRTGEKSGEREDMKERARTSEGRREAGEGKDNLLCCQYVAHNDRLLDFSDTAIIVATDLSRSSLA